MKLSDFHIGREFISTDLRYRVTDVGTRAVLAIQVDSASLVRNHPDGTRTRRTLTKTAATKEGLFRGPPYGITERPFDEYEQVNCVPVWYWMFFNEEI